MTDSFGANPSLFLKAFSFKDEGVRLLNVAFSRAQCKLIILANCSYIRESPELKSSFITQAFSIIEGNHQTISLNEIPLLSQENIEDDTGQVMFFPDKQSSADLFSKDIEAAKQQITFFAPTIMAKGENYWQDFFKRQLKSGVGICLGTKRLCQVDENQSSKILEREAQKLYRNLGITLEFSEHMPGKICIIDGNILWHIGEPNPDFPSDKSIATRIHNQTACKQAEHAFRNFYYPRQIQHVAGLENNKKSSLVEKKKGPHIVPNNQHDDNIDSAPYLNAKTIIEPAPYTEHSKSTSFKKMLICPDCGNKLVVNDSAKWKFRCKGFPQCRYQTN
nr:hypothetical protein [Desulfobulbaceae bacterium]